MFFSVYRFSWIDVDVCGGCMYMYLHACMQGACRVHACVMPYFGLAVNVFIVFTVAS